MSVTGESGSVDTYLTTGSVTDHLEGLGNNLFAMM